MNTEQDLSAKLPDTLEQLAKKEFEKKKETAQELVDVIGGSKDVLVRVTTVFPLTLFPDTITVDRTKLTITHRNFIKSGESTSINIEDILNVVAGVGPFFGTIKIISRFFHSDMPFVVRHLTRRDALLIKRILQGYIIAIQKEVDCSALSTSELTTMLDELGKVAPAEKV